MNPTPPETASPAVQLDPVAVAKLHALDPEGRTGVVRRVLAAYETSLARMLVQLTAELDGGEADVVRSIAHTLKSSSASVGAMDMARTCAEVEQRLRTGAGGELSDDVQRLLVQGESALAAVRAMLRI